jgi:hypothetical protein
LSLWKGFFNYVADDPGALGAVSGASTTTFYAGMISFGGGATIWAGGGAGFGDHVGSISIARSYWG